MKKNNKLKTEKIATVSLYVKKMYLKYIRFN